MENVKTYFSSFLILTGAVVRRLTSNQIEVEQLKEANLALQDQLLREEERATRLAHITDDILSSI